jgi:hypothetical protein
MRLRRRCPPAVISAMTEKQPEIRVPESEPASVNGSQTPVAHAQISRQQAELLEYVRLGAGVWLSAIFANVPVCKVLRWLETGKANPAGRYGAFAREFSALIPSTFDDSLNGKLARLRVRQNGNGSAQILYSLKSICLMNTILPLSFLTML